MHRARRSARGQGWCGWAYLHGQRVLGELRLDLQVEVSEVEVGEGEVRAVVVEGEGGGMGEGRRGRWLRRRRKWVEDRGELVRRYLLVLGLELLGLILDAAAPVS